MKRRKVWKLLVTVQLVLIRQVTGHLNVNFLVSTQEHLKKKFKKTIRDHLNKLTRLCVGKKDLGTSCLMNLWRTLKVTIVTGALNYQTN